MGWMRDPETSYQFCVSKGRVWEAWGNCRSWEGALLTQDQWNLESITTNA